VLGLRQKAEAILGDKFQLKEFHDVIINSGALPLKMLEQLIDDYIDQKAGFQKI
jgi:uncharacterized protein (DUF885 family)